MSEQQGSNASVSQMPLFVEFKESVKTSKTLDLFVFIHGWGMHSGIWSQVLDAVKNECHTLCLDLPGMGRSPILKVDYTLAAIVQQCEAALMPYQEYRLHLIGWSMGAIVAAELAQKMAFASLTLIAMGPWFVENNSLSLSGGDSHEQGKPPLGMPLSDLEHFQALLGEDFEGTLYRFLGLNTKGSQHQRAELRVLQQLVFCYGLPAPKALAGGLDILKNACIAPCLHNLQIPLWVVLGEHDALVPAEFAAWFGKNKPKTLCSLFKGAGHIPFLSQPVEFAKQLLAFKSSSSDSPKIRD